MNLKPRPFAPTALLLCFFLLAGTGLCLEGTEYQIKGAMMVNFIKFVEWPEPSPDQPPGEIIVGIVGKHNFGDALDAVSGKLIGERILSIRYISTLNQISGCRVLFIPASEAHRHRQILRAVSGRPVLTIGEDPNFVRMGGIIRFYAEEDHIRFEINQTEALRANLKLSAKLLEIAGAVY